MKKVLIIANLFHASPRIPGLAKYLPEFGWEPTILTVPYSEKLNLKIVETPYSGDIFSFWRKIFKILGFKEKRSILNQVKKKIGITSKKSFLDIIFNFYRAIFAYPDEEKNWRNSAIKVANELFQKEKFDAIISSSSPVTSHLIACKLKESFHIPWTADLRDLWTQNHNYPYPWWRKMFEKRLELKTLSSADALVTVSSFWADKLKSLHKKETIYTITNGFDPEEANIPQIDLTPKFTITYTGRIYSERQNPSKLFAALKNLIDNKIIRANDIEVRFYGSEENWLTKEIENYGLSLIVKRYGTVSRKISLEKQRESQLLLLLNWEDKKEKGVIPSKIFEYFAAKRPILATGGYGGDEVEKLIQETKAGVYCPKVEDVKIALEEFYSEYKNNGYVAYRGNWREIQKYSQKEMAKRFSEILNAISQK